ncbi:eukaryotic aspartyl protease, putative [Eimeria brunetti]|uniref:Eukaryotic aspartyl protease, putative n=1 Tax=Eimeria brunetti TaxID=51314 RepID=U6LG00_9EIME|nr:eukaryotic aspartyl protease, putative [Eimeria brunetti]
MENYLSGLHVSACDDKKTLPDLVNYNWPSAETYSTTNVSTAQNFQFQGVPTRKRAWRPILQLPLPPSTSIHPDGMPTIVELQLSPDDYVLEFINDDGVHECMLGIAADESENEDVLMRGYYTVFDRDHLAVGFVRAKH